MENYGYKMQYLEESYEKLTHLGEKREQEASTFLVKHRQTGKIAVMKYVDISVLPVYEKISKMDHPHLEKIDSYASGQRMETLVLPNGTQTAICKEIAVVITEYIGGMTLHEYMERKGVLDGQEASSLMGQLLEVLEAVHEEGIIHRDINPDNIMISSDGVLKLIDFGIAREKKVGKSQDTTILGTVGYAAPEQFGFLQTDERTDIYAVGVLLNKMLTGYFPTERLYDREPMKNVIVRCTALDLEKRFKNIRELATALDISIKTMKKEYKLDWLPGFRTGVVWKNVVATIGYCLMIMYSIGVIVDCAVTWQGMVLEIVAVFIYIWMAALLAANIGNWDRKVPVFKRLPKAATIVIRVFLWMMLFYYGVMLDNYVRYDLLGFPKM